MKKNKDNKKSLKIFTLVLIAALVTCFSIYIPSFADQTSKSEKDNNTKTTSSTPTNDETVYVMTKATGAQKQVIVSEDGTLHYDGYEDCKVPVTMDISYELDGESISPAELAGKSGQVTMKISYTNNIKYKNVYVPFMAVTGVVLDNDYFSNVQVENGRSMDDGNRNVVLGYAFPGLQKSLGVSSSKVNVPDEVTITADTENFQIESIYTILSSDALSELNIDTNTDINGLTSKLNKLENSASDLLSGTKQLYAGTQKLNAGASKLTTGTDKLVAGGKSLATGMDTMKKGVSSLSSSSESMADGMTQLANGATSLKTGADSLNTGAQKLQAGTNQLSTGLSTLSSSSESIRNGAKAIVDATLATANTQLKAAGVTTTVTADNYATVLGAVTTKIDAGMKQITDAYGAAGEASDQYKQLATEKATIAALKTQLDSLVTYYNGVLAYTAGVDSAATGAKTVNTGAASLTAGTKSLSDGAAKLADGSKQLSAGLGSLGKLISGVDQLDTGANQLYGGLKTLRANEDSLVSGISQLNDGAKELNDGVSDAVKTMKSEMSKLDTKDLETVMDRVQELKDASESYQSFGGKGSYDSVKFIYKTDDISPK